jgi:uncharacterized repeat protein (TIGR01451 family)
VVHQIPGSYASSVRVHSAEGDSAASAPVNVSVSDLISRPSAGAISVNVNSQVTFLWRLDNTGAVAAHSITLSSLLPLGVSFVDTIPSGVCTPTSIGAQTLITCNTFTTLAAGDSASLQVTFGFNQPGTFLIGYSGVSAEGDPAGQVPAVVIVRG